MSEAPGLPEILGSATPALGPQLDSLAPGNCAIERLLTTWHRSSAGSRRFGTVAGVGLINVTGPNVTLPDSWVIRSGRQLAASLGLVPRPNSSGGKDPLRQIRSTDKGSPRRLHAAGTAPLAPRGP